MFINNCTCEKRPSSQDKGQHPSFQQKPNTGTSLSGFLRDVFPIQGNLRDITLFLEKPEKRRRTREITTRHLGHSKRPSHTRTSTRTYKQWNGLQQSVIITNGSSVSIEEISTAQRRRNGGLHISSRFTSELTVSNSLALLLMNSKVRCSECRFYFPRSMSVPRGNLDPFPLCPPSKQSSRTRGGATRTSGSSWGSVCGSSTLHVDSGSWGCLWLADDLPYLLRHSAHPGQRPLVAVGTGQQRLMEVTVRFLVPPGSQC